MIVHRCGGRWHGYPKAMCSMAHDGTETDTALDRAVTPGIDPRVVDDLRLLVRSLFEFAAAHADVVDRALWRIEGERLGVWAVDDDTTEAG